LDADFTYSIPAAGMSVAFFIMMIFPSYGGAFNIDKHCRLAKVVATPILLPFHRVMRRVVMLGKRISRISRHFLIHEAFLHFLNTGRS